MGQFLIDISKFVAKANGNVDTVVRGTVLEIARRVDMRSPVGDATYWKHPAPKGYTGGRFRGAWMLGVGAAPTEDPGTIDKSGGATLARTLAAIPEKAAGKVFFYANNLPYAMPIERGTGSPRQAPAGVVGVTALEFSGIVDDKAREVAP